MAKITPPIPQDKIGENFVWRDWFQRLSDKVFGTISTQDSSNVSITGGTIVVSSLTTDNLYVPTGTDGQVLIGSTSNHSFTPATLTAGANITVTNGAGSITIASTSGSGTVTSVAATVPTFLSVAGSPITTSGTLAISLSGTALPVANGGTGVTTSTGTTNVVLSNSPVLVTPDLGTPSALVGTNITGTATAFTSSNVTTNANLTGDVTSVGNASTLATVNSNVGAFTNANITVNAKGLITAAASGSPGGVTSVTGTSPVVSSGGTTPAISLAASYGDTQNPYASKTANYILAAPDGTAGVPTFRAVVATDIPTLNQNTTGTAANITATSNSTLTTLSALSLPGSQVSGNISGNAANVTGTVAIANGGTGNTTATAAFNALSPVTTTGDLIIGNGTNSSTRLAIGANNYVLTSNGTTASWAVVSGSGATISNDTSTATNLYPLFANATSGSLATVYTSNANYLYKPSTGELTALAHVSSNGIQINATTVSTSYTIATGNNGLSAGPVSINTSVTVTISTGSVWTVV